MRASAGTNAQSETAPESGLAFPAVKFVGRRYG
jgi:hypothetical protein